MDIDRCAICFSILTDTETRRNTLVSILTSLGLWIEGTEATAENLKPIIKLLYSPAYADDSIKTKSGLAGSEYIGFEKIKPIHFIEIQQVLHDLESEFIDIYYRTSFSDIDDSAVYFQPNMAHITEIRESIEKLLRAQGIEKEDFFITDEHNTQKSIIDKDDFTDTNLINTHIKSIHLEDARRLPYRWWVDRFYYNEDYMNSWGWNKDEGRIYGQNGDEETGSVLDVTVETMKSSAINIYGNIYGQASALGPSGENNKYDAKHAVYRDKKSTSDTYKSPEGETEFNFTLGTSCGKDGWATAKGQSFTEWKPWSFRLLRDKGEYRPNVKLKEDVNVFIDMPTSFITYTSGDGIYGENQTFYGIRFSLAFTDINGDVYPLTYILNTNEYDIKFTANGYIYANLDSFLLDKRWIILDSELIQNHLSHYYGDRDYYFVHSISLTFTAYAFCKGDTIHGNTSTVKGSFKLKQVGLTSKEGFFRNILGGPGGGFGPDGEVGEGESATLPYAEGNYNPYEEYNPPEAPIPAPLPETERSLALAGSPYRTRDTKNKTNSTGITWNPYPDPPIPAPLPERQQEIARRNEYTANTDIQAYASIIKPERYWDTYFLDPLTSLWNVLIGGTTNPILQFAVDLTQELYEEYRENWGSIGTNYAINDGSFASDNPLSEYALLIESPNASISGQNTIDLPGCATTWSRDLVTRLWTWRCDANRLYKDILSGTMADIINQDYLDIFSLEELSDFYDLPEDVIASLVEREYGLQITYPDESSELISFRNADFDSGGKAEAGTAIINSYLGFSLNDITTYQSSIGWRDANITDGYKDSLSTIGNDFSSEVWDGEPVMSPNVTWPTDLGLTGLAVY